MNEFAQKGEAQIMAFHSYASTDYNYLYHAGVVPNRHTLFISFYRFTTLIGSWWVANLRRKNFWAFAFVPKYLLAESRKN